ncbi:MAG: DUF4258 domain-containing protein [Nitrospiraceae bacterium]|nr:MAG: DUF4258 domain-containing protein [Nitrospiraceae bacterium]
MNKVIKIKESDIHSHIKARMKQRGISMEEIQAVLTKGWNADDAVGGTIGKVFVFPYKAEWEGNSFEEKEVTVYYKYKDKQFILLTAKARYGKEFLRREDK